MDERSQRDSRRAIIMIVAAAFPLAVVGFSLGYLVSWGLQLETEVAARISFTTGTTGGLIGAIYGATYVILDAIRRDR